MTDSTQHLYEKLLMKLEKLDNHYDPRQLQDTRLDLIVEAVEDIKGKLLTHIFLSKEDEIHYFKSVLPELLSLHIYYSDRIEWDRIRFIGSSETKNKFIARIYTQAENFRSAHKEFYEYCRDGKTSLDRLFFLRDSPVNQQGPYPLRCIIDRNSPTVYCEMMATLIAYNRLEHELKMKVAEDTSNPPLIRPGKVKLRWTGKQIDLIELGYGLKEAGSFNHGRATLNEIFDFFQEAFEFDTGNTSRLFQDIITRKIGQTSFLDLIKEKLRQRIEIILG